MTEFLQGTADVPGLGKTKKVWIYGGLGVAGTYVAWRWYQASRDEEPEPGADGFYSSTDQSELGLSTTGGPTNVGGNSGNTSTDGTTPGSIDTNSEWTNEAAALLGNAGYDSAAVYAALGDFLARRALDKTEATIARAALAAAGQPPVNGPFSVIEEAGTNTGTLPAPTNVRQWEKPTPTSIAIQWDAVTGASHYRIYRSDLGDEPIGDSFDTKFRANGLAANRSYTFFVRAVGSTSKIGGASNRITLRTVAATLTKPTGLRATNHTRSSFRVTCSKVTSATYYRWYLNGRPYGASDGPTRDFTSLKPNTTYKITVAADTGNQSPGPVSAALTVKTKR
ncbi:hypothetical protein ABZ208_37535 [Streptomyces sp. NPDC006208]|uniref:fibronectin type III domain-containing protein n=1 Tax=Streptomyces sp. NPDC006208 TaxID=3156734 RepID=UPI0033A9749D